MKKRKKLIVVLALLAIVFAVGLSFLYRNFVGVYDFRNQNLKTETVGKNQGNQPPTFPSEPEEISIPKDLPQGVKATSLKAVEGHLGAATVLVVDEGDNFALVLEARLPDLGSGIEYFVWLSKDGSTSDVFKLGKLEKKDQLYIINFEQKGNFSKYNWAIVTEETDDDRELQTKVLEGSF